MVAHISGLMDLAALDEGAIAEDVGQSLAQTLATIDDEQQRSLDAQATLDEVLQGARGFADWRSSSSI